MDKTPLYLVLDLGGTTTRVATSKDLRSLYKVKKTSTSQSLDAQKELIADSVQEVSEGSEVTAICVGIPGIVKQDENKFGTIPNIPILSNLHFKDLFPSRFADIKISAANDAALAGLGEAVYGAGKKYRNVAYITISTGVGGVKISDKRLDLLQSYYEPGHHILDLGGPLDTKIHMQGTFEAYASGTAFKRNYGMDPRECNDTSIWEDYGNRLAVGLVNVMAFWAPDIIVLGGGVATHFDKFISSLKKTFLEQNFFEMPEICKSELEDNSGLFGAMALIEQCTG